MNAFFFKIFGASWFTSLLGYVVMAGSGAVLIQEAVTEQGFPTDAKGWLSFVLGLAMRFAKQSNVSNAEKPMAVAQAVEAKTGETMATPAVPMAKP